ncbi:hypothetical protein EYZ11_000908 [Aspergillus tanneri]|uniref:Uncharacterized protein n=1 Tax=Aspergillus tanneri TaxID=1220188 RepID=A0A4S3JW15_9EURO|nr:uncharacterized protein ATNIH1004_010123 [Aspergillus tanneri]KAA8643355.1 hypothetical protein ATNIH1004_010123 [Aspergillus tanneri]THC99641.1 hypothetical protein EYZ11_000908 [Aspergillus tanneri]
MDTRRSLSTTAKALIQFFWKGTKAHPKYEQLLEAKIKKNQKLAGTDKVDFAGDPHTSDKDEKQRASGQIFKGSSRLTSVHVYENGDVI